jgi:hypothetical protein
LSLLLPILLCLALLPFTEAAEGWSKTYDGGADEVGYAIIKTTDGGYAVAGEVIIGDFTVGNNDVWLLKTDAEGVMEWNQTYALIGSNLETAYDLVVNEDDGYTLVCSSFNASISKSDIWLIRTDNFGVIPEHFSIVIVTLFFVIAIPILLGKKKLLGKHHQPHNCSTAV